MSITSLEPPSVMRRGRHRDHALAAWRRARALELRLEGKTYQAIADELGYAARGTVSRIVNEALQRREAEDVDFLRQVEHDRLGALQFALWDRAMEGHVPSVRAILRILDLRCRLVGLYDTRPRVRGCDWPCCQGPPTVVIRPDDCRWEGCAVHGRFATTTDALSEAPPRL